MFKESLIVTASRHQRSSQINRRAVVLNLQSEEYFVLNPIGTDIWLWLSSPRKIHDVRDAVLSRYQVRPQQCDRDLMKFLLQLKESGLIRTISHQSPISRMLFSLLIQLRPREKWLRIFLGFKRSEAGDRTEPSIKLPYEAPLVSYWGSNLGTEQDVWIS
ncbi:MAG: PqqD family protein [Microcoleaceae cyanobacterium]